MTRNRMTPLMCLAALASFGAATLSTSSAEAGRVVVLAVQGDPEGELEDGLISIIEDRHDLVTSGEFDRAARKSGVDDLDGPAIGKLARKLGADAVVEGTVSREDEGFLLVVRIRGADGKTVKKVSVDLSKPRLSAKAKRRLSVVVLDGVDKVLGIADEARMDGDEDDEEEEARKPSKKEQAKAAKAAKAEKAAKAKQEKKARAKAKKAARDVAEDEPEMDDEGEGEGEEDEGEGDDEDSDDDDRVAARDGDDDIDEELGIRRDDGDRGGKRARDPRRPAVRIEMGPSAIARTLSFTTRPDFAEKPLGYKTTLVPGARVAGEVYPFGFKDPRSIVSTLGIGFEFDQTLMAKARTSDAPEVPMPVNQKHYELGLRFRYAIGDKDTLPSVTVGVGYGRRIYGVDRNGLPDGASLDVPDVDYKMIVPSLALRIPIGTRIALNGGGKFLAVRSSGPVQRTESYGGAKITGFEANAGLEVRITGSVLASLAGSMTQIGYDFVGNGAETNERDLDADSQDVGGMGDRYLGVVATVGYAY